MDKLNSLRKLLQQEDLAGYIISTTDEYLSEYTPIYAKRLEYITGFTGSNGLAVILKDKILFFTDGRYLTQAKKQLAAEIFDQQKLIDFPWKNYIAAKESLGFDPKIFTKQQLKYFSSVKLKPLTTNLIDKVWNANPAKPKPLKPTSVIYQYDIKYAGESYNSKIKKLRKFLRNNKASNFILTHSDSVCWLLNIRAHDIDFSPLLLAFAIVTLQDVFLFTDKNRLTTGLANNLDEVTILAENQFNKILKKLDGKILYDENLTTIYVSGLLKSKTHQHIPDPCLLWKACKNDTEIKHMQIGHEHDAVAVCEMLSFISNENIKHLSEYDLAKKLTNLRANCPEYIMDSFPTICGFKENGAIIHYSAQKAFAKKITGNGLLLIDSGGQYLGCTTDITRTIAVGEPTKEQRYYYTKVLKGHIALAKIIFPDKNITGGNLDVLARQFLWQEYKDYAHGTGHGVGSFLNVHEGPQNISPRGFATKLMPGMVMSNEPGYYVPGKYGIRIENMMYVKGATEENYLQFEPLTLVPYSKKLIDKDMITTDELSYLANYYQKIKDEIRIRLSNNAQKWLDEEISWVF
ncbi:MAG: aminopeptidase P family protein [Rickettsiaceae bacterium]|nr:aminopeptidase P family protein [Rickettsiaceae bacterium]